MTRDGRQDGGDIYDWWSRHPRLLGLLYAISFLGRESAFRARAEAALALEAGEHVLEVGCGPGNSFSSLDAGVGSTGTVTGVDTSRGMVRRAEERTRSAEWPSVHVVQGDGTMLPIPAERMDAAYASMSLSAVPDPVTAIREVHRVLRPGGRVVILDVRPIQEWPVRLVNRLVAPISRRLTNWKTDVDIPAILESEFETVSLDTYTGGAIFIAVARKAPR